MLNTGNIYLHKILSNTVCWALWEDLFTQNIEEYCMKSSQCSTWSIPPVYSVNKSSHSVQHKVFKVICLLNQSFHNVQHNIFPSIVSTISTMFDLIWFSGIGRENSIIIKHYTKHMLNTVERFIHTKY
jgi:hypothetical protein